MARWSWRRWFSGVDYEHELPRLADQMRAAQLALDRSRARQRKVPALILVIALVMYAVYALVVILTQRTQRPAHTAGLALTPVLLWQLFVNLRRALAALVRRRERALKTLTDRRKKLVDEYKKKTNFDKIRELVADPDAPELDKAKAQADLKNMKGKARHGAQRNGVARSGQPVRSGTAGTTGTAGTAGAASLPSGASAQGPIDPRAVSPTGVPDRSARPPSQFGPPPPYRRTWVDRLVDLVLGENEMSPANRDALICPECFSHNGLAPFGKSAKDITYRCPVCGHLNVGQDTAKVAKSAGGGQDNETDGNKKDGLGDKKDGLGDKKDAKDVLGNNNDDLGGYEGSHGEKDSHEASSKLAEPATQDAAHEAAAQAGNASEDSADDGLADVPAAINTRNTAGSRQSSPADSVNSAKSLSKHLEGPDEEAQKLMSVEERIMQEIRKIQDEIDVSKAALAKDKAV